MDFSWAQAFVWLVAAFYILAGVGPLANMKKSSAQYVGWGYPAYWPYVTAVMEVAVGILLFLPQYRMAGVALGIAIMLVAIGTVVRAKEYSHAVPPAVVAIVTALVALV